MQRRLDEIKARDDGGLSLVDRASCGTTDQAPYVRLPIAVCVRTTPDGKDAVEEEALWAAYKSAGDKEARDRLVEIYQPLVRQVGAKSRSYALSVGARGVDLGDLVGLAEEGLLRALETFDPDRGVPFAPYAKIRVTGHVKDALRNDDYLTRRERESVKAWLRGEEMSAQRARRAARLASQRPKEVLPEAVASLPDSNQVEDAVLADLCARDAMRSLSPMEKAVLNYRYARGMSLSAIGTLLQVTESRVSQVHRAALGRLREREAS
jgi:RNA polymerase sigma factor for flagellar operon FliA